MTWRCFITLLSGLSGESRWQESLQAGSEATPVMPSDAWAQQFKRGDR